MAQPSLAQRRIVVTGGLGALGRAVAGLLLERGARVVLLDKADAGTAGELTLPVIGSVDLGDEAAAAAAFRQAAELLDGLDGLVNVAGGFSWETLADGSVGTWDRLYQVNLRSAVVACQQALPLLLASKQGRVVNVGALAAQKAGPGMGAYAASKAGVARLTEALAEELKDRGVTVNAVLPSILDTPANRADMPEADATRWVSTAALAAVVAFLLSDDAAAVTGALIPVAGRV